jgi:hypothetical protein
VNEAVTVQDRHAQSARSSLLPSGEMKRGFGPAIGLAVISAALIAMFTNTERWQGHWVSTVGQLHTIGILLTGPIAAAGACWLGGRERRRGLGELRSSMPRSVLMQTIGASAPAVAWPVGGYFVAAAVVLVSTWPYATVDSPPLMLIAADLASMAALSMAGFALGQLISWRLAAPSLAVLVYAILGSTAFYGDGFFSQLSPTVSHYGLWDRPVWWYGPVFFVWMAGIACTILLLAGRRRGLALAPLAAAAGAAVLLVNSGDDVWRLNPETSALVCANGKPKVCVTELHREQLLGVEAAIEQTYAKLEGVPDLPEQWSENPTYKFGDVIAPEKRVLNLGFGEASVNPTMGREVTEPGRYLQEIAQELAYGNCQGGKWTYPPQSSAVVEWLAGSPDTSVTYYGARPKGIDLTVAWLEGASESERNAWLNQYFDAVEKCDAKQVPTS